MFPIFRHTDDNSKTLGLKHNPFHSLFSRSHVSHPFTSRKACHTLSTVAQPLSIRDKNPTDILQPIKFKELSACFCIAFLAFTSSGCDVSGSTSGVGNQEPDPVVVDLPIAFVERPLPINEDGEFVNAEFLDPTAFNPGAKLILKSRASTPAPETVLTQNIFPDTPPENEGEEAIEALYDVKDIAVSPDGMKLLFAMRAPEPENDNEPEPTWNIWEYNREENIVRRLIDADIIADAGHDIAPQYLPDGRIVFSSTRGRRTRAILLDENKPQYAPGVESDRDTPVFNLHIIDDDGLDIEQITFNPSHDLDPTVLGDGRILFTRWDDFVNQGDKNRLSFYTIEPDGSDIQLHYGYNSQNTGTNDTQAVFARPIQVPDGRILVNLRPRDSDRLGGDIVAIDTFNFIDNDIELDSSAATTTLAQSALSPSTVLIDDQISPIGYYNSAYPMYDGTNRLLVSWSLCQLQETEETTVPCTETYLATALTETAPSYGIWVYNLDDRTQLPVKLPEDNLNYTDVVVLTPRTDAVLRSTNLNGEWANEGVGVVHIRNLWDVDGVDESPNGISAYADPATTLESARPLRFLRLVKAVQLPDEDTLDFDGSADGRVNYMRDILGYVPIELDGSAKFKVPANVPFSFSIVDATGKRVNNTSVHENWLSVQAGETKECRGCHDGDDDPHGREDAQAASAYAGAPGGLPFTNTLLLDEFGFPHIPPEGGETMAEYYARIYEPHSPSVDLTYTDEWTNIATATPLSDINLTFSQIISGEQEATIGGCTPTIASNPDWTAPALCATSGWTPLCRLTINYPDHIEPLWSTARNRCQPEVDDMGNPVVDTDGNPVYEAVDLTCTRCHSNTTIDENGAEVAQFPAGNFSLTSEVAVPVDYNLGNLIGGDPLNLEQQNNDNLTNYTTSYAQLLFNRRTYILQDDDTIGLLTTEVDSGVPLIDENGDPLLDDNGDPLIDANGDPLNRIDLRPIVSARPTVQGNASGSDNFFSLFETGGAHEGYLLQSELKLIAEWLDVGAQYYNNPFDAPLN